jgi:hypothetical protein
MVHYRRGNTDQARRYFELGEQGLAEDHSGWSAAARRLRDEAAELLGITEEPNQTDAPGASDGKEKPQTKGSEEEPNGEVKQDQNEQ